jgi:hypothetical protein
MYSSYYKKDKIQQYNRGEGMYYNLDCLIFTLFLCIRNYVSCLLQIQFYCWKCIYSKYVDPTNVYILCLVSIFCEINGFELRKLISYIWAAD